MMILKVTKNQGFTLSLEYAVLEKPQGEVVKLTQPRPSRLNVNPENCIDLRYIRI